VSRSLAVYGMFIKTHCVNITGIREILGFLDSKRNMIDFTHSTLRVCQYCVVCMKSVVGLTFSHVALKMLRPTC
jgi:hypothetical protein